MTSTERRLDSGVAASPTSPEGTRKKDFIDGLVGQINARIDKLVKPRSGVDASRLWMPWRIRESVSGKSELGSHDFVVSVSDVPGHSHPGYPKLHYDHAVRQDDRYSYTRETHTKEDDSQKITRLVIGHKIVGHVQPEGDYLDIQEHPNGLREIAYRYGSRVVAIRIAPEGEASVEVGEGAAKTSQESLGDQEKREMQDLVTNAMGPEGSTLRVVVHLRRRQVKQR